MLEITELESEVEQKAWDRFVEDNPLATGYHLSGWRRVIQRAFGHSTFYYQAVDARGNVHGILPLVYFNSSLFGSFLVSLPFLNYGGVVADTGETAKLLLAEAKRRAQSLGANYIELRHVADADIEWPKKEHKVSMRLDLPSSYADLMKSFPPKLRSQVRRAEKEGMTTNMGGINLLDGFYEIFSRNMRDLGTPVYAKQFFMEVLRQFPTDTKICLVKYGGRTLAAGLAYGFRNMLEIPWASSDRRYGKYAPNMMLYGAVLRYACERGYRVFDFGRSSKDSGTYRFKEQWGAKPIQLRWHYWLRDGHLLPELNPQNQKFRLAIAFWKRLPISVTTFLGPRIAKHLP